MKDQSNVLSIMSSHQRELSLAADPSKQSLLTKVKPKNVKQWAETKRDYGVLENLKNQNQLQLTDKPDSQIRSRRPSADVVQQKRVPTNSLQPSHSVKNQLVLMGDDRKINLGKSTIHNEEHVLMVDGQRKPAVTQKKAIAE